MDDCSTVAFVNTRIQDACAATDNMITRKYLELATSYMSSILSGNGDLVFNNGVKVSGTQEKNILFLKHKKGISDEMEKTIKIPDAERQNIKHMQSAFSVVCELTLSYFSATCPDIIDAVNVSISALVGPHKISDIFLHALPYYYTNSMCVAARLNMMLSLCKCLIVPRIDYLRAFVCDTVSLLRREAATETDERVRKLSALIKNIAYIEGVTRVEGKGVFNSVVFSVLCENTSVHAISEKSLCVNDKTLNPAELFYTIMHIENTRVAVVLTLCERERQHIREIIYLRFLDEEMVNTLLSHDTFGICAYLKTEKYLHVEHMFCMLENVKKFDVFAIVAAYFKTFVEKTIMNIVSTCENPTTFVRQLLDFRFLSNTILVHAFNRNVAIYMATSAIWKAMIKPSVVKNIERIVCEYTDLLLRPGNKTESLNVSLSGVYEGKAESVFSTISNLIGISDNIDKFSDMYMTMFIKRVTSGTYDEDMERQAIGALVGTIEPRIYNSVIQVLGNASTWPDMVQAFNETLDSQECALSNLSLLPIMHIQNASSLQTTLIPPKEMATLRDKFVSWFSNSMDNTDKKLSFAHALGKCTVEFNTRKRKYQVVMNDIQTAIVCLLNENQTVSIQHLLQHTGLTQDHLLPSLVGLVKGKLLLENKENSDRLYSVNMDFEAKTTRVVMPNPAIKLSEEEISFSDKRTEENRACVIQAAIVRIMKAAKGSVNMNTLFSDVVKQIKQFSPTMKTYKQAVESLIEKEYLKRAPGNGAELVYIS
jgi:hypothetical protein